MSAIKRWIEAHPTYVRSYVPIAVTLILVAQLWEMTHR